MNPLSVGLKEASQMLGIAARTLRKFACERRLPSVKLGGRLVFRITDLEAFLAANVQHAEEERPRHVDGKKVARALGEIGSAMRGPVN
jgi:excisionase family DNA binding protein